MTNSPPANVRLAAGESARVLASGFDTLYLAADLEWGGSSFFEYLAGLKQAAKEADKAQPGENWTSDGDCWRFTVQPYGKKGYEWLLDSRAFRLDVGAWDKPTSRPSVMIYVGSETLWAQGVDATLGFIDSHLEAAGASVVKMRASRVDVCVDLLLREGDWHEGLARLFVTRANQVSMHTGHRRLTGFSIGRGAVGARLYDKPAEIQAKGRKQWMFEVWGIPEVPKGYRVVRVEFQLRREALKDLKLDTLGDVMKNQGRLWAYCAKKWLTVREHPERHVKRRKILPWWHVVQNGYAGAQDATPLVRDKAIRAEFERCARQIAGHWSSMIALRDQGRTIDDGGEYMFLSEFRKLADAMQYIGVSTETITGDVVRKLPKYLRTTVN